MKCNFCKKEIGQWDKEIGAYLVATKDKDNHFHIHGTIENKDFLQETIEVIQDEASVPKVKCKVKEVVFHNRQRIGDILMFTCGVRDFKKAYPDVRVNVISTASHIWDHNPHVDRTLEPTEQNIVKIGPGRLTNSSNRIDWHFANAYRVSIEDALGVSIPQGESRPDIYITEDEFNAPRITEKPYWIIVIGGEKGWGCKMYPYERWQAFVQNNPDMTFVQIGTAEDNHPRLVGKNVIDYIGKTQDRETGIRDLYKLFLNAEGSIGLVSFHMHLSGALNKPCIVVAGAREPVSFTRYAGHQYLATDGTLPCGIKACWHCDIKTCTNLVEGSIPKCVDIITPADLQRAFDLYYEGGRLSKHAPSKKEFKQVVKAAPILPKPAPIKVEPESINGFKFGGGSLTVEDWAFILNTMKQYNVKRVLEFGAGLSTILLNGAGKEIVTYETSQGWIDKVKKGHQNFNCQLWDGKTLNDTSKYDFAFVDGPAGGANREIATKVASQLADIVIVHDASRIYEKQWQEKYLKDSFRGPIRGGHRCHLWIRSAQNLCPSVQTTTCVAPAPKIVNPSARHIKFISTARGWGGCARSVTTLMDKLIALGQKVEFVPFRGKITSREMLDWANRSGVIVTENYHRLHERCDTIVIYADDFVWEFQTPEVSDLLSNLNADKKIMVLNYRRGKVGNIEWTKGWDKYMFLNSTQEQELLSVLPNARTKVLPPCTDLTEFFKVTPKFEKMRIVRHSSQGDTKFDKTDEIQKAIESREDLEIAMMPCPSWLLPMDRVIRQPKTDKQSQIAEFLATGSLFWYSLPKGYMDMGPRVILEAMAAGLPILADNWGGAKDRVTPETGWICDSKEQMLEIIRTIDVDDLMGKGYMARERAKTFDADAWVREML